MIIQKHEFIKLIAMITMLIDHIGWLILPSWSFLRIIGRIAMPCYAYLIGCGLKFTHDRRLYFWRLLFLAVISQFGFIQFDAHKFNIIFTFALSVATLSSIQDGKFIKSIFLAIVIALGPFEYGIYATVSIIILQYAACKPVLTAISYVIVSAVAGIIYKLSPDQSFAVLAVTVIYFAPTNFRLSVPKYFWRLFYPVHWWGFVFVRSLCVTV